MTITSKDNEKLKLVRKLARKHREREGLFVTEGEDLESEAAPPGMSRRSSSAARKRALKGKKSRRTPRRGLDPGLRHARDRIWPLTNERANDTVWGMTFGLHRGETSGRP